MAIPQGGFLVGAAGITSPGGAFAYAAAAGYPQYFAGTFFINTGYDDPITWTAGVDCAEVYGARVYPVAGAMSSPPAAGTFIGKWNIVAEPVWQGKFWVTPHGNTVTQKRILIRCQVYLSEPYSEANNEWQRLDNVDWSLYRL